MIRIIGLDIRRICAEAAMLGGGEITRLGRIGMAREYMESLAQTLTHDNRVVIKATGNATAISNVLAPHVGCVVIATHARCG